MFYYFVWMPILSLLSKCGVCTASWLLLCTVKKLHICFERHRLLFPRAGEVFTFVQKLVQCLSTFWAANETLLIFWNKILDIVILMYIWGIMADSYSCSPPLKRQLHQTLTYLGKQNLIHGYIHKYIKKEADLFQVGYFALRMFQFAVLPTGFLMKWIVGKQ